MSKNPPKCLYEFGPFRLDPREHSLLREGEPVPLTPKVFDILKVLVENNGHLFGKDELMRTVWPDSFVEEGNLTRNISTLRTALGENSGEYTYIETVPKLGYRFVAPVREVESSQAFVVDPSNAVAASADAAYENPPVDEAGTIANRRSVDQTSVAYRALAMVATIALAAAALTYGLFFRKASTAPELEIKSLAVLPLKSLSKEKDDSYLGLGLADTIITRVNQIDGLVVRQTSSIRKYNEEDVNALDAGRQLQVDSVLDGTVQRSGERLRINLNLIRTKDGASLWSDTFIVSPTDIFRMQDDVSRQVAAHLRLKLRLQGQALPVAAALPVNADAYDYYLRAKFHTGLQTETEIETAITLLERAVQIDPNFAAAYAELAMAYRNRTFALKPQDVGLQERAFADAEKALSLDPDLAEAHIARGLLLWTHNNQFPHERAIQEYRRALELNPNSDEAHHELASVYNHIGLLDKAADEIQRAVTINPTNTAARFRVGINLLYQGQYEQALAAMGDSSKFNPGNWAYQTSWALFQLDRKDEAAARIKQFSKDYPQDEGGLLTSLEALLAAAGGDERVAKQKIERAAEIGKGFGHFHHTAYAIASAYALMNQPTAAVDWLQKAADDGFPCYPLFERDPNLKNLRQDKRFVAFMARLKEQWERYKATL